MSWRYSNPKNEENELIDKRLLISNSAKIVNAVNDALINSMVKIQLLKK